MILALRIHLTPVKNLKQSLQIKLLIETKPIVCLPWEILHYKISREKLEPEPGFEPRTSGFLEFTNFE